VIRSEIRSRAEHNCALPLQPSHQRDIAHRPIGTGRLRARRRFGYWGEQIGRLRDQNDHHLRARRQNSSLQSRVGIETAMENVESTDRPATDRERTTPRWGVRVLPPLLFPLFATPTCDVLRFRALDGNGQARGLCSRDRISRNWRLWNWKLFQQPNATSISDRRCGSFDVLIF
jgi:hypothetical protein